MARASVVYRVAGRVGGRIGEVGHTMSWGTQAGTDMRENCYNWGQKKFLHGGTTVSLSP